MDRIKTKEREKTRNGKGTRERRFFALENNIGDYKTREKNGKTVAEINCHKWH